MGAAARHRLDVGPTIVLNGRDTGVPNRGLGAGCTMTDAILAARAASTNHGSFVSAVAHLTDAWKAAAATGLDQFPYRNV